ncbi:MAG: diphthine synthase [archaeon GBS-70-058]|nr:diphthine synthase [Candidatus Culexarchaeum nevadense]
MLVFVGLGLNGLEDITVSGMKWIRYAEKVYLDMYTSIIPNFSVENLEKNIVGRKVIKASRKDLEENYEEILNEAKNKIIVLLVPGDPFVATTHMQLRLAAIDRGIETKVIHAPSIQSAIYGETGLFSYKFGRCVTVTFPYGESICETPYDVIKENMKQGLHTLLLLDMDAENMRFMRISEAIDILKRIEEKRRENVIKKDTLCVGCARIGSDTQVVRADYIDELSKVDFGAPPYSLVIVGRLHFIEAEALVKLANAPLNVMEEVRCQIKK